ncbi:MAG: HXXEE domain-containing protein [Aristaeellaceae bacterium]
MGFWFVEKGWLCLMAVMGIVLSVQLAVHWKDWDFLRKAGAFTVIVLVLHVMEEWVMPGGFHYYYNIASAPGLRDRYPMNMLSDMLTNLGGALLWFALVQTNRFRRRMGFAVMLFGYAELAIHVLGASASRTLLLASGAYSPFYGPGLLTAVICWLPLSIACSVYFVRTKIRAREALGGVAILIALSALLIFLPERLLAREDTPFVYANAGWYEQFIDDSGAIIDRSQPVGTTADVP